MSARCPTRAGCATVRTARMSTRPLRAPSAATTQSGVTHWWACASGARTPRHLHLHLHLPPHPHPHPHPHLHLHLPPHLHLHLPPHLHLHLPPHPHLPLHPHRSVK
jgi:hypothetical protein